MQGQIQSDEGVGARRETGPANGAVLVLASLLALFGLIGAWTEGRRAPVIDFFEIWAGSRVAGTERADPFYDLEAWGRLAHEFRAFAASRDGSPRMVQGAVARRDLELYSTPAFYTLFRILPDDYELAWSRFLFLALISFSVAMFLFARFAGHGPVVALLAIGTATMSFQPHRSDVWVGGVNQIQLLVLGISVAALAWDRRPAGALISSFVLAAAACAKPNLVYVVPLLMLSSWLQRRNRDLLAQCAGTALGVGVMFVWSSAVFGSALSWFDWYRAMNLLPRSIIRVQAGNFGLVSVIQDRTGLDVSLFSSLGLPLYVLFCFLALRTRGESSEPGRDTRMDLSMLAGGLAVFLATSWLAWIHYHLLALPAILLLLRGPDPGETGRQAASRWVMAALILLSFSVDPWSMLFDITDRHLQSLVVSAGEVLLLVSVIADQTVSWRRMRTLRSPAYVEAGPAAEAVG